MKTKVIMMMLVMAMAGTGFAGTVTFSDSTFADVANDWQAEAITARNSSGLITVTSVTVAQQADDGDDDGTVLNAEMVIGSHTGGRYLAMGAMCVGGTFDPSAAGAINSIDFGFTCDQDDSAGPFIRPLLKQGGNYYAVTTGGNQSNGAWKQATVALTGLVSDDWDLVNVPGTLGTADDFDITSHPDFTGAGGEITFGIWLNGVSSTSGGTTFAIDNDFDNFAVSVDYVPEPATMFLLGLGGMLLRKRR